MELYVLLDDPSTRRPEHDRWLQRPPNVHLHLPPIHTSRLDRIDVWFGI